MQTLSCLSLFSLHTYIQLFVLSSSNRLQILLIHHLISHPFLSFPLPSLPLIGGIFPYLVLGVSSPHTPTSTTSTRPCQQRHAGFLLQTQTSICCSFSPLANPPPLLPPPPPPFSQTTTSSSPTPIPLLAEYYN